MRKIIGYTLLVISCLAWILIPIVPFLPVGQKAIWVTGLIVFGEITWLLAVVFLGKEILGYFKLFWQKIKAFIGRKT